MSSPAPRNVPEARNEARGVSQFCNSSATAAVSSSSGVTSLRATAPMKMIGSHSAIMPTASQAR